MNRERILMILIWTPAGIVLLAAVGVAISLVDDLRTSIRPWR